MTRPRPALLVAAAFCAGLSPALAAGTMAYGSRVGMDVTIVSMSGIGGRSATIRTRHTRENALAYCRDYENTPTAKCVAREMATPLSDEVRADCTSGRFVNFFGEEHQFLGPRTPSHGEGASRYAIRNRVSGEVADGSSGSGYPVNLDIYRRLCPGSASAD